MEQFEFKCPQCGKPVSADESLRGLAVPCPHCEKGIVVPQKATKPILAPIPQRPAAQTFANPNLQTVQRRTGEAFSEQKKKEKTKMSNRIKPSAIDWLKVVGLIAVLVVVAIDIAVVRGRNKTLWNNIVLQKTEMEKQVKAMEIKLNEEVARTNRQIKESEKRIAEAKSKVKDAEAELREKEREMQLASQKKIDELKASYETRIREMRDDFSKRLNDMRTASQQRLNALQKQNTQDQNMVRCRRCAGQGSITEKVRCTYCGGSGKIKETTTRWKRYGNHQKVSTTFTDCPHCLPGAMRGSGSKGYTIERKPCPNCNGAGLVNVK